MKLKFSTFLFFILISISNASELNIDSLKIGFDMTDENVELYREMRMAFGVRPDYLVRTNENKREYYELSFNGGGIGHYSLDNKVDPDGWPLTPWEHLEYPAELRETYSSAGFPDEEWMSKMYLNASDGGIGCLNKTPLRYGKISNAPEQESLLVLLFNYHLIFFSPKYQRTVFATYYNAGDALTKTESDELKEDYGAQFMEQDAQFISGIFYGAHNIGMPGHRIYSKIYVDDFNKDGNVDILVWSKSYKSNKTTEPVGFTLLRNEFKHYTRDLTAQQKSEAGVTGEYLPQDTSPATIQSWLSAKNLTWQKGFPSQSECVGEEGKLIPEMHDPLLNDPDVLK